MKIWNSTQYTTGLFQAGARKGKRATDFLKQNRSRKDKYSNWTIRDLIRVSGKLDSFQTLSKREKEFWMWLREEGMVPERPLRSLFKPTAIVRKKDSFQEKRINLPIEESPLSL